MKDISKNQIEDLEIRLSNSRKLERDAKDQIELLKKDSQRSLEDLKIVCFSLKILIYFPNYYFSLFAGKMFKS